MIGPEEPSPGRAGQPAQQVDRLINVLLIPPTHSIAYRGLCTSPCCGRRVHWTLYAAGSYIVVMMMLRPVLTQASHCVSDGRPFSNGFSRFGTTSPTIGYFREGPELERDDHASVVVARCRSDESKGINHGNSSAIPQVRLRGWRQQLRFHARLGAPAVVRRGAAGNGESRYAGEPRHGSEQRRSNQPHEHRGQEQRDGEHARGRQRTGDHTRGRNEGDVAAAPLSAVSGVATVRPQVRRLQSHDGRLSLSRLSMEQVDCQNALARREITRVTDW